MQGADREGRALIQRDERSAGADEGVERAHSFVADPAFIARGNGTGGEPLQDRRPALAGDQDRVEARIEIAGADVGVADDGVGEAEGVEQPLSPPFVHTGGPGTVEGDPRANGRAGAARRTSATFGAEAEFHDHLLGARGGGGDREAATVEAHGAAVGDGLREYAITVGLRWVEQDLVAGAGEAAGGWIDRAGSSVAGKGGVRGVGECGRG